MRFLVDMRGADVDDRQVSICSSIRCFLNNGFFPLIFYSLDDEQLRDDLMTMLIAGHETTAAVLTWATFLLAQVMIITVVYSPIFVLQYRKVDWSVVIFV